MERLILFSNHHKLQAKECSRFKFWFFIIQHRWFRVIRCVQHWTLFYSRDSGIFQIENYYFDAKNNKMKLFTWNVNVLTSIFSLFEFQICFFFFQKMFQFSGWILSTFSTWFKSSPIEWHFFCLSCNICHHYHYHPMLYLWS